MAKGRGRPNKYFTHVQPRLKEITDMALTMTDEQICKVLGVGKSAWCEYKNTYTELADTLKDSRCALVRDLRNSLIQRAKGYKYIEKKQIVEDGIVVREEIYEKAQQPDVGAIHLCLKNYDRGNWSNDWDALELKKEELEIKKQNAENGGW